MKRVGVVVLNWNGWEDTLACLVSLRRLDYPHCNLLVVDNASTDGSVQHIQEAMPMVEILQSGANLGFGGGCNVGIRHLMARGADYVWLVNSDSTVDSHALSALVKVAEQNLELGSVGSVLYEADQSAQIQLWGGGRIHLWLGQSRHRLLPGPLDFISGASVLLRCSALEEVGLFDEATFFMYWEDADLAYRIRQAGWKSDVASQSIVWHKQSASLGKGSPLLDEYFTHSGVRFLRRYAPVPFIPVFLMLCRMLAKRLLLGDMERIRAVMRGYWRA